MEEDDLKRVRPLKDSENIGEQQYTPKSTKKLSSKKLNISIILSSLGLVFLGLTLGLGTYYLFNKNFRSKVNNIFSSQEVSDNTPENNKTAEITLTPAPSATKAAELRVKINAINKQHVTLATTTMMSAIDAKPDLAAAQEALDRNSLEMAKSYGAIYGEETEKKYLELWRNHTRDLIDYSLALKSRDKTMIDEQAAKLNNFVDNYSKFIASINIPLKEDFRTTFQQYVDTMRGVVDAYIPCDFTKTIEMQNNSYEKMNQIADKLSLGILSQYPERFN